MPEKKGIRRILPPILGGEGPLGLKLPNPLEGSPVDLIRGLADGIQALDHRLTSVDQEIAAADQAIAKADQAFARAGRRTTAEPKPEPTSTPEPEAEDWQQASFPGQTKLDYCIECLRSKHFPKALGLAEEAMSFSRTEGRLSKEGALRVQEAVKELVTADKDIETAQFEAGKEIQAEMRRIRKEVVWKKGLMDPGADLKGLEEMIQGLKGLLAMTEKAATTPGMTCPDCQRAISATCDHLGSPFREKCTELCRRMIDYKLSPQQNAEAFDKLESLRPGLAYDFYRNLYGRQATIPR